MKRILFLSTSKLQPESDGASIYSMGIIRSIATLGNQITLVNFYTKNSYTEEQIKILKRYCTEIYQVRLPNRFFIMNYSFFTPITINKYKSLKLIKLLRTKINNNEYDSVFYDHLHMYHYDKFIITSNRFLIEHNVESEIWRSFMTKSRGIVKILAKHQLSLVEKYEKMAISKVNGIISISKIDMKFIKNYSRNTPVFILPPQTDFKRVKNENSVLKTYRNIIFIGSYRWFPNQIAANYLINDLMPQIREHGLKCKLYLVGSQPTKEMIESAKKQDDITITGWVDSVDKYIIDSDIFINPINHGSGVNIKIIEALGKGIPIISTEFGVRGLDLENGVNYMQYNKTTDLIEKITFLMNNPEQRYLLSNFGRLFYESLKIDNNSFRAFISPVDHNQLLKKE